MAFYWYRDYPRFLKSLLTGAKLRREMELADRRARDLGSYLDFSKPLKVLDLANGELRPQYSLLRSQGHNVYGVDLLNKPKRDFHGHLYRIARFLYAYRLKGFPSEKAETLICGDIHTLPFPDATFDSITSAAAFEHFLNFSSAISELSRVLRPGGMLWASIHVFTSLSGGHNISCCSECAEKLPAKVEPWDHLRKRRIPFSVPLNELRISEYLNIIGSQLEIMNHYQYGSEGESLLTSLLKEELSEYTKEELTCGAYTIVAKKLK